MRRYDWGKTSLGPPETWPLSLRTVVRILLTSRYAMWLGWGPDLAFLYNDAYARDTLGAKHPWALGRPAAEVWAEIWDQIGPAHRTRAAAGRGHLGRGTAAVPRAQRLSRRDLPHLLLQSAARRRGERRRQLLRGHRGNRAGHRRAPAVAPAESGRGPGAGHDRTRGVRGRGALRRARSARPAVLAAVCVRQRRDPGSPGGQDRVRRLGAGR